MVLANVPSFRFFVPGNHANVPSFRFVVPGEHPNVPSFRFSFRGNIRQNHPFEKPPFCQPPKDVGLTVWPQVPLGGPSPSTPLRPGTPPLNTCLVLPSRSIAKRARGGGIGGRGKGEGWEGRDGLWLEGRVLQLQWRRWGGSPKGQLGPDPHVICALLRDYLSDTRISRCLVSQREETGRDTLPTYHANLRCDTPRTKGVSWRYLHHAICKQGRSDAPSATLSRKDVALYGGYLRWVAKSVECGLDKHAEVD